MERPSLESVRAIITGTLTDAQINLALDDAVAMMGECGLRYSADQQRAILRNLAAHILNGWGLAGGSGPGAGGIRAETIDGNSVTYAGAVLGEGVLGSTWGQTAMLLDTLDCLRNTNRQRVTMDKL